MDKNKEKNKGDYKIKATALDGAVSAIALRHTETCREMTSIHSLSPIPSAALGRLCGGLIMMSSDLKKDDATISATVKGDGVLKGMVAVCTADGKVRGYVGNPRVETVYREDGKLDIGSCVGEGELIVIKDNRIKEPYIGRVKLVSGEIAQDLAAYYLYSEQIPTVMGLGVKMDKNGVTHAGGFMVRLLPDAGEDVLSYIEQRAKGFPEVTWLLEEGFSPGQILDLLLGDPDIKYYDEQPCGYECTCSKGRMRTNLITLGKRELGEMSKDPSGAQLECHFCNTKYLFTQEEIKGIYKSVKN